LSHDIDSTDKAWLRGSYHELRKGRINSVINLIYRKFLLGNDAWFNLEEILEYERENGVYSTFFFIPRKGKKDGIKNADYDINNEKFQQAIEKIRKKEFEVGLHGSIGTHSNSNRLIEDLQKVNHNVLGNRFHFLKFDITKTPKTLENAGIKYDSTLGFSEHYGFRNGICFPFYLYDIEQDEPLNVIEIPLMFMDATLRQKNYLNLNKTEIIDSAEKLIQEIKKFNGIFSILWHNTYFSEYKYSGWKEILDELINLSKSNGLTFLTGKEIAENFENQLQEY
jgi:peptidoglycan/xylan/chitin deacetylase (PgdA/CDA1 family)